MGANRVSTIFGSTTGSTIFGSTIWLHHWLHRICDAKKNILKNCSVAILLEIAKVMANARFGFILVLASGVYILWLCCGTLGEASGEVDAFVPPLGFHFLTSLYDSVVALTCRESSFRQSLVEQCVQILQKAHVGARCSTLEIGCGTGSLLKVLADSLPTDCTVAGVDIDEKALQIARQKLGGRANISLARANELPFAKSAIDHVFVSLVLHHLGDGAKDALIEAARVLAPHGHLYIAEWGPHQTLLDSVLFFPVRVLDGFGPTSAIAHGHLDLFLSEANLILQRQETFATLFGPLSVYLAAPIQSSP